MPSFLARIRALSQSTTSSSLPESIIAPETPQSARPLELSPVSLTPDYLIKRKAVPDINTRSTEPEDPHLSHLSWHIGLGLQPQKTPSPEEGLSPSPVRTVGATWEQVDRGKDDAVETTSFDNPSKGKAPIRDEPDAEEEHGHARPRYDFLTMPPLGSSEVWSTFGRSRKKRRSSLAHISERSRSSRTRGPLSDKDTNTSKTSSLRSTRTVVRTAASSRPNTATSTSQSSPGRSGSKAPSRQSSGQWSTSQPGSSDHPVSAADTVSSSIFHHHSNTPPSPVANRFALSDNPSAPSLHSSSISRRISSTSHGIGLLDSPGTFGYPTPARPSEPTLDSASATSSSPSLPHTQLSEANYQSFPTFDIYTQLNSQTSPPQLRPEQGNSSVPKQSHFTNSVSFPSLPFTFGRFTRHEPKRSQSSRILPTFSPTSDSQAPALHIDNRAFPIPRSESFNDHERRESAQRNAQQALRGVMAGSSSHDYGWPADVSREMVRLSLQRPDVEQERTNRTIGADGADRHAHLPGPSAISGSRETHVFPPSRPAVQDQEQGLATHTFPSSPSSSFLSRPGFALRERGFSHSFQELRTRASGSSQGFGASNDGLEIDRQIRHSTSTETSRDYLSRREIRSMQTGATADRGQMGKASQQSLSAKPHSSTSLGVPALNVTAPTPQGSLGRSSHSDVEENGSLVPETSTPGKSEKSQGKRKAEETEDGSPPGSKPGLKTTFAVQEKRGHRSSNNSSAHAPSSYHSYPSRKRVRLSSPMTTPEHSRPGSSSNHANVGSWPSRRGSLPPSPPSPSTTPSRHGHSRAESSLVSSHIGRHSQRRHQPDDTRSLSHVSIPISAIVSPHVPSVDNLSTFHMRDPRKPPRRRSAGWGLRFRSRDDPGSPFHAWAFWVGFLFPPLWWIASVWRIPRTRVVGGVESGEKTITVDDPQIEHDARSWRFRCQIMSVIFFFTYAPVIALLAIFVPRS